MKVTVMLCDAAQESGGKLYILGGGWSNVLRPGPVSMALAIKIEVPWTQTNERHQLRAVLLTEDGVAVDVGGSQVIAEGEFEVGRPAGLKPGTPLDVAFALPFAMPLEVGGYRWELEVDGKKVEETTFRVLSGEG